LFRSKYRNTAGPDPVNWGDTSFDEMMVMGFQYVYGDDLLPLSAKDETAESMKVNVFPNPANNMLSVNYSLQERSNVKVELTNVLGETVYLIDEKSKPAGNYLDEIDLRGRFATGLYQLTFRAGNSVVVKKIMIE
jgi:hypothetical protein